MSLETEIASLTAAVKELTAALSKSSVINLPSVQSGDGATIIPYSVTTTPSGAAEPPAAEEKPKRTRKPKDEPIAEPNRLTEQPAAEQPAAEQPAAEQPAAEQPEVKLADLQERGAKLMAAGKTPELKALVTELGAAKLSALAPDLYPEALKRLDALLEGVQ